jgi:hypothetical protein
VQHGLFVQNGSDGQKGAAAAAFTFGREDLLPALFQRIVDELNLETGGGLELFRYYLNRHSGLDGDEHGPRASRLMQSLCGSDESLWAIAEQTATKSLEARREFWDGIYAAMRTGKAPDRTAASRAPR